jgi:hypothetical protein
MDWRNPQVRAALLALQEYGEITHRRGLAALIEHLENLGWLLPGARRDRFYLSETGKTCLPDLLNQVFPDWREVLENLKTRNLPLSDKGLAQLKQSARNLPPLPRRLHHKTWAALSSAHSKATPAPNPDAPQLTQDNLLRVRPNRGLQLRSGANLMDCDAVSLVLGEISLPERALLDGLKPLGRMPGALFTVENLGAFVDMTKPDDICLIFQPGWNTPLSLDWVRRFPAETPWYQFGDLDPEGIEIYLHLKQKADRPVHLWIAQDVEKDFEHFTLPVTSPWMPAHRGIHPIIDRLIAMNYWLEQEAFCLRLPAT